MIGRWRYRIQNYGDASRLLYSTIALYLSVHLLAVLAKQVLLRLVGQERYVMPEIVCQPVSNFT